MIDTLPCGAKLELGNIPNPPSQMFVRMKADGTVPAKGFIANYTRVSETTTMLLILIHMLSF